MSLRGIVAYLVQLSDARLDAHGVLAAVRDRLAAAWGVTDPTAARVTALLDEVRPGRVTMDLRDLLGALMDAPRARHRSGTQAIDHASLARGTAPTTTSPLTWQRTLPFVIVWRTPAGEVVVSFRRQDGTGGRLGRQEGRFFAEVVESDGAPLPACASKTLNESAAARIDQIPWRVNRALGHDWIVTALPKNERRYRLRVPRGHVLDVLSIGSTRDIDERLAALFDSDRAR